MIEGVSERNSCCRLANYMERITSTTGLEGYIADAEYNRKQGGRVKTIIDGNEKVVTITADLILHSRGALAEDNLVAIEMKKSDRPVQEKSDDRDRLRAMTKAPRALIGLDAAPDHVCGYRLGIYIELNNKARQALIERYVGGERVDSTTRVY